MVKTANAITEAIFPNHAFFEYYLQRLRIVIGNKTPVLKVHEVRDVPDSLDELPSIEVVIRIPGLKLKNPVTDRPLLSKEWFKEYFESRPSQEAYLRAFAKYIAACIPANSPEARLKKRFESVNEGRPSSLPARADLFVEYDLLVQHVKAARKWLRERPRQYQGFSPRDKEDFLGAASEPVFWWVYLVRSGEITLEQIAFGSPQSTAKQILALKYGVSEEAIRSRLSRRELGCVET